MAPQSRTAAGIRSLAAIATREAAKNVAVKVPERTKGWEVKTPVAHGWRDFATAVERRR
jgi:hypothetical protein